ncbi:hypothetical protein P7K49_012400 [Saguinus oedipus]|uniref:Uncharacterized protein n=1 Tax=Saguinus oedipus TaxID=9490 RepID=A0ABQ9VTE0_SAGOE|nr:hypothetical protein P7K49_012400 [Saguinus oedipus]
MVKVLETGVQFRKRSLEWKHSAFAHSTGEAQKLRQNRLRGGARAGAMGAAVIALLSAVTLEANHDFVVRGGVPTPKRYRAENFRCEKLQKEKEELERRFEDEVKKLGWQQQAELQELEERLQLQFEAEMARLQEEHRGQLLSIGCQHQEQENASTD